MNEIGKTKLPNSGEWWLQNDDGTIVFICGFDPDGDPVYMDDDEELHNSILRFFTQAYHHEPLCTGFDWLPVESSKTIPLDPGEGYRWLEADEFVEATDEVFRPDLNPFWVRPLSRTGYMCGDDNYPVRRKIEPVAEVWPKWYLRCETTISSKGKEIAYSKAIAQNIGETWHVDGSSYKWHYNVSDGWVECTESEALARVAVDPDDILLNPVPGTVVATGTVKLTPVESPDDWVEFDAAQITCPRVEIDWLTPKLGESQWMPAMLAWSNATWAAQRKNWKIRCRRCDLPVETSELDNMFAIIAEHTQQVRELTQRIGDLVQQVNERDAVIERIRTALRADFV